MSDNVYDSETDSTLPRKDWLTSSLLVPHLREAAPRQSVYAPQKARATQTSKFFSPLLKSYILTMSPPE